jgi:hypothetical protein
LTAATRRRLADLLPRLDSDQSGEVAATAAAIGRVLRSSGHDWHDLSALILSAPVPEGRPSDDTPDWRVMTETAIAVGLARTEWERQFLAGLRDWSGGAITEKQARVLERIYARGDQWA